MAEIKKYLDVTALGALVDQIKAEDAKVKTHAEQYADSLATNYDGAGSAATAEKNAKDYTDQLATGAVATNTAAIATLNGDASTAGSVAKAVADAKAVIDADIEAVEGVANQNKADIAAINNAENGILAQAKAYAEAEDAKVQGNIDALSGTVEELEAYVGEIPADYVETNVIAYINKKAEETLNAASGGSSESAASVLAALNSYKAENDPKVTKNTEDIAALATALDEEAARAGAAEKANADAIKAITDDYLKEADKTELQGNINTVSAAVERLTNGVSAEEIDGVNDLIQYVKDHGTEVIGMQEDIADNASAIEGVTGRMTTAEGKITTLEGAVATKAEQTALDEAVGALEDADDILSGRIATLEGKFGGAEGSVEDMISDAQDAAEATAAADATTKANAAEANAKAYTDAEVGKDRTRLDALEADTHTHSNKALLDTYTQTEANLADAVAKKHEHSNLSVLEGITSAKVTAWDAAEGNAKTYADGLNSTMTTKVDGVDSRVTALEEAAETHALASDLTDAVGRIAQNETDIAALTSSVNSFTAITADEVNALFA